jgi:hypothetical protein
LQAMPYPSPASDDRISHTTPRSVCQPVDALDGTGIIQALHTSSQ